MFIKKFHLLCLWFSVLCVLTTSHDANATRLLTKNSTLKPTKKRVGTQLKRIARLDAGKPRKNIVVLGAGMAGLTAAYELKKLNHSVTIIEPTSRVGGRVWTHYFDSTGQYQELGAMRIPLNHDYTRHYIDVAELTAKLRPFITAYQNNNCFLNLRGKTSRMKDAASLILKEFSLSSHEQEVISENAAPALLGIHLSNALKNLNIQFKPDSDDSFEEAYWGGLFHETFINGDAVELENLSLGDFLRDRVQTKDARELIGVSTGLELWWDKAVTMFLREEVVKTGKGLEEIEGGFNQLPNTLARKIGQQHIRFNTEVVSIDLQSNLVKLKTRATNPSKWDSPPTDMIPQEEIADHVICTIPFSVMRRMHLNGLSPLKMQAIRNLTYASSTKVLLNFTDRFWEKGSNEERILGGASMSDQITRCTYYPSDHAQIAGFTGNEELFNGLFSLSSPLKINPKIDLKWGDQPVPGALLGSYNWGQDALRLGILPPKERAEVVIDVLEQFHPDLRQFLHPTDSHASMCWDTYRWTRGAFCGMRPNDVKEYYHAAKRSEANIYFAGEHCSLDNGWIQGAIRSGLLAVEELVEK